MKLSESALQYVEENALRSRMICSNCRRWERVTGITEPERITPEVITAFRAAARAMGLANDTTEKTITDVLTVVRFATGERLEPGKRLPKRRPEPSPASNDEINALFAAAETQHFKRWLAISFWTGLRLADSLRLMRETSAPCEVLKWRASKTGVPHVWPVPTWLREWLAIACGVTCSLEWSVKSLQAEFDATRDRAGLRETLTPKMIRQASVTAWTEANGTAGALVHGSGIGVLAHYLQPLRVLEAAATRVLVPSCFGATSATDEESLMRNFRRLDAAAQGLITGMSERLAAG